MEKLGKYQNYNDLSNKRLSTPTDINYVMIIFDIDHSCTWLHREE